MAACNVASSLAFVRHHRNPGITMVRRPRASCTRQRRNGCRARAAATTQEAKPEELMKELASFLEQDLPHLFDEQGIDTSRYEERMDFRDPITKYETVAGYVFNIQLLRYLFQPEFILHKVKQTGPNEITTRWTMRMTFGLLPWRPELVFTGVSIMGVNLQSGKFCSHVDIWDSVKQNEYFSLDGAWDVLKQLRFVKTPDLETPKYTVLRRTSCYEVRKYEPFLVAESKSEGVVTSKGFNNVTGYIFGNNQREEKMKMTTPVFNERTEDAADTIQVVLPSNYELSRLPAPTSAAVELREVTREYAAATRFSGEATEELVRRNEQELRNALVRDGLDPLEGFLLARYNDPGRTPAFLRRNEVLIWLRDFHLRL